MKKFKNRLADYEDYKRQYEKRAAMLSEGIEVQAPIYESAEEYGSAIDALVYEAKEEAKLKGEKYHGKSAKQWNRTLATNQVTGTTVKQRKMLVSGIQAGEEEKGEEQGTYFQIVKGFYYGKNVKGKKYNKVYQDWKEKRDKEWETFTQSQIDALAAEWSKQHKNSRETFSRSAWEKWLYGEKFLGNRYVRD